MFVKPLILTISLSLLFPILIPVNSISSEDQSVDVKAIIKRVDELYRSKSSYAEIEMQVVTPHWERTLTMEAWTKDTDRTFIRINSPKKEEGMATLRIGNEMWNYLPKVNKVMKIPPSMMMGSWMGSDFTNDDLVHELSLLEDYDCEFINPEGAEPDLYYVKLTPKEGRPIVWSGVITAIRKVDYIPVWEKFYDEKGNTMRILNFRDIKDFGGRRIPAIMEMVPQNKEGHKTVIRYLKAEFDSGIDDNIFTLRGLRKG